MPPVSTQPPATPVVADEIDRGSSPWHDAWLRLRRNRLAVFGAGALIVVALACLAGPWLSPYGYCARTLGEVMIADAILDRPHASAHQIDLRGESMRRAELAKKVLDRRRSGRWALTLVAHAQPRCNLVHHFRHRVPHE